jgi:multiple sugar transport system permease protein
MKLLKVKKETQAAYLCILPWLLGFIFIIGGPFIFTIILGFTRYDIFRPPTFVGLQNYIRMFSDDDVFIKSLTNTLYYSAFNVPISVIGSLLLAILVNNNLPGMNSIKTALYIPSITSGIAMAMLWMWIFDPGTGLVNTFLSSIGVTNLPLWFQSPSMVKPTMIIVKIVEIGGARMIIFLAGLQGIPKSLYEVAYIDGASAWTKFRKITIPMLSPIVLLNLVTAVIDSFRVFVNSYAITEGGPLNESMFLVLYIYKKAFTSIRMGYASAVATVFLVIVLILTIIELRISKNKVHYAE